MSRLPGRSCSPGPLGAAVVAGAGAAVGAVSERDILYAVAERGVDCLRTHVRDPMTADAVTCTPDASIDEAMAFMTRRRIRHLPVLDGGAPAGIVGIGDVVKGRLESAEREGARLREYIQA